MAYKRSKEYNKESKEDLLKVKLFLKKVDELRIDKGKKRTTL